VIARIAIAAVLLAATLAGYAWWHSARTRDVVRPVAAARPARESAPEATVIPGRRVETPHYSITSTATEGQTRQVAAAVESLHAAYARFFKDSIAEGGHAKLQLVLYKDQQEFKRNNRSSAWAEAYYLQPTCYAYFGVGERNPYHWMLHEATHQLNTELAGITRRKWVNEGLASYFGASRLDDGTLVPGSIDTDTYPIWWLPSLELTGDVAVDVANGRIISLRALLSGVGGPEIAQAVNQYYIGYWSLTHFLFHFDGGRYAEQYRLLIASGGSVEQFEKLIGPIERVEPEWYGYLREQQAAIASRKDKP